jgi:hypothetical protein
VLFGKCATVFLTKKIRVVVPTAHITTLKGCLNYFLSAIRILKILNVLKNSFHKAFIPFIPSRFATRFINLDSWNNGISLGLEVSLFVASPEIEGRNAVEADNWTRHKKTFYSEWYILFYLQADHKTKIEHNSILKNEFYKGWFGARVPGVENDP